MFFALISFLRNNLMAEMIITLLAIVIFLAYSNIIIFYFIGWRKTSSPKNDLAIESVFVSIVIACRDEEENIMQLLKALRIQDYKAENFEVIIVNDHSEDKTLEKIEEFRRLYEMSNLELLNLTSSEKSKKEAVRVGVYNARGRLIVTTDADCSMGRQWLSEIVRFYIRTKASFIIGPVLLKAESKLISIFQHIEFAGLMGSGAGSIFFQKPLMCNGANLAFEKDLYLEVNREDMRHDLASGDDMFLMLAAKNNAGIKYGFIKSRKAVVETNGKLTFQGFISQRRRWVSKNKYLKDDWIMLNGLVVLAINMLIILFGIGSFFNSLVFSLFLLTLLGKFTVDFILVYSVLKFYGTSKTARWYIFAQLFSIASIPVIIFNSFKRNYEWKGRIVR